MPAGTAAPAERSRKPLLHKTRSSRLLKNLELGVFL
jgi:hypothetical protein